MSLLQPRTFLDLAQRAAVECGVASNAAIASSLPTVVGATGSLGRVVNWVGDAWTDIQMAQDDWNWMRSSVLLGGGAVFPTVPGQASYPLGTGAGTVGIDVDAFGKWDPLSFRNYTTAIGPSNENYLAEITFDKWRNGYMYGTQRNQKTRPVAIAIGPDQSLCLGPPPDGLYTIEADYFVGPSEMVADTDVPVLLPFRFNMLIVYRAMMKYAGYESAPEVYTRGSQENATMYAQLLKSRGQEITMGGALA